MSVRDNLRQGLRDRFPLCCVLRYTLEDWLRHEPEQALERGIRFTPDGEEHVPCRILHEAAITLAEYDQLLCLVGGTMLARALERTGTP